MLQISHLWYLTGLWALLTMIQIQLIPEPTVEITPISENAIPVTYVPELSPEVDGDTCLDFEGREIPISLSKREENKIAWAALRGDGQYVIEMSEQFHTMLYTRDMYTTIKFIIMHECAHMMLGHIKHNTAIHINKTAYLFAERNADCWAAVWIRETEGDERFLRAVKNLTTLKIFHKDSSRYKNIITCYNGI